MSMLLAELLLATCVTDATYYGNEKIDILTNIYRSEYRLVITSQLGPDGDGKDEVKYDTTLKVREQQPLRRFVNMNSFIFKPDYVVQIDRFPKSPGSDFVGGRLYRGLNDKNPAELTCEAKEKI